jgi:hypothetical protein
LAAFSVIMHGRIAGVHRGISSNITKIHYLAD